MKNLFLLFLACILSFFSYSQLPVIKSSRAASEYQLEPLTKLNTGHSEFGAVAYKSGIVFVAEQKKDLVNFEGMDVSGHPYLDMFYSEKEENGFSKPKTFSRKQNSPFHDGPIAFNRDYTCAYFTRAVFTHKHTKTFVNQSKLYILTKKGEKWSKPVLFKYDSDSYSLGHASVSSDGSRLFFASDMPGGYGGTDLYVCTWQGMDWGAPQNLGPEINSPGNELFPFIRSDSILFFSSDKKGGLGGLDVYSAEQAGSAWMQTRPEGATLNSSGDDFAIYFTDPEHGYVSSNRDGNDDLYGFSCHERKKIFGGYVLNSKNTTDPCRHLSVELCDSMGNTLQRKRTDTSGYFEFGLSSESFTIRIDEKDSTFDPEKRFYFADARKRITGFSENNGKGRFAFHNLSKDQSSLQEVDEDDVYIAGNFLSKDPSAPVINAKLLLKDKNGNVLDSAITNEFGSFLFSRIPPGASFTIEAAETDGSIAGGTKITLTNKAGEEITTIYADANGKFKVRFLEAGSVDIKELEVDDADLKMDMGPAFYDGNNEPIAGLAVVVKDGEQNIIGRYITDSEGKISLHRLRTDKSYTVELDESDPRLDSLRKIIVKSKAGRVVEELFRDESGHFVFHLLKGERNEVSEIYVDDPWLPALNMKSTVTGKELVIEEQILYGPDEYGLSPAAKNSLSKVIGIVKTNPDLYLEIGSHTDSKAGSESNRILSDNRAKTVLEYMVKAGIPRSRLKATGYGETRLKNRCADGVSCTEEEHAENRRTEFRMIRKAPEKK